MIFSSSLNLTVKKAFGQDAMQSSVARIMSHLNEDPRITTMDTVVLGPKDLVGPKGKKLASDIPKAHKDICFIYIYNKPAEADLVDCPNKKQMKKLVPTALRDYVEDVISDHLRVTGAAQVTSADFVTPESDEIEFDLGPEVQPEKTEFVKTEIPFTKPAELQETEPVTEETIPGGIPAPDFEGLNTEPAPTLPVQPLQSGNDTVVPREPAVPRLSMEAVIENVRSIEDWEVLKSNLMRDAIYKRLIEENTEYQGLINIIDTLDYKIQAVWRDTSLSAEQKFDKIKAIGLDRATATATANSIMAEKVIGVIAKVTLSAKRTVEDKLESYDKALYTVASKKMEVTDVSQIDHAIEQRAKLQFELLALARKIVDLYKAMDILVTEEITELDAKLPSSNAFINDMMRPIGTQIFTPKNTATLANNLLKALQDNRVVHSQLESQVNALIETMFELFEKDTDIINYQQNMIAMLRAHHVEDVVIVDSVLKHMLRIYTGADGTGRSSTAITWCGVLSRRHNCLLLDLTGKDKFSEYGITPMDLDDFMRDRVQKQFLCVRSSAIPTPDQLQTIIEELKTRLDYYPYVNIIMDPEDIEGIEQASTDALTIHYICNCTKDSMNIIRETIQKHTYPNIARKLVMIDPPISPLAIADSLGVDPTLFKLVMLPNVPEIRACAIQHDRPYEYENVSRIFEEAFR